MSESANSVMLSASSEESAFTQDHWSLPNCLQDGAQEAQPLPEGLLAASGCWGRGDT